MSGNNLLSVKKLRAMSSGELKAVEIYNVEVVNRRRARRQLGKRKAAENELYRIPPYQYTHPSGFVVDCTCAGCGNAGDGPMLNPLVWREILKKVRGMNKRAFSMQAVHRKALDRSLMLDDLKVCSMNSPLIHFMRKTAIPWRARA